jgi:HipA-like protein
MSSSEPRFDVWLGDLIAGRLTAGEGLGLRFDYEAAYRDSSDATPLSMSLPLTRDQHAAVAVTGSFVTMLPEQGLARRRLEFEPGASRSNVLNCWPTWGGTFLERSASSLRARVLPRDCGVEPLSDGELAARLNRGPEHGH